MRQWWQWVIAAIILLSGSLLIVSGKEVLVSRVIDGDTIELNDGKIVRLFGIDTPESGGCYFNEAKKMTEDLVLNQKVKLELDQNQQDQYGRTLAYVWVGDKLVNEILLQKGAGSFFFDPINVKHQSELIKAANDSHDQRFGLWSACQGPKAHGCSIKGNLDRLDKRYYHLPEFRHYDQAVVNLDEGDRWFCSEAEAISAGFEQARE